jgi:hypothetical protein
MELWLTVGESKKTATMTFVLRWRMMIADPGKELSREL